MTENPSWNEIDKILREIEIMGKKFFAEKGITLSYIDLWRWDVPETAFWWVDSAGINKRICFTVDESGEEYSVWASGSAWMDSRETMRRKWLGVTFTPLLIIGGSDISDYVRRYLLDFFVAIFQKVSVIEEKDLVNAAPLQPMPDM